MPKFKLTSNMHYFSITAFILLMIYSLAGYGQSKPNIVLIFIDDWAWYGTPVPMDDAMPNSKMPVLEMPNLEKLADQGMIFRNAYSAAPQCSPSRVALQTGQSSPRNGFTVYMNNSGQDYYNEKGYPDFPVIPNISDQTIDPDATTIPEYLKPLGYVSAHVGKWHMRGNPADEGYVIHDGATTNKEGNDDIPGDPKRMFSITEKAIDFMEKQVQYKKPFYLQISHYAMHAGYECLPETREKYIRKPEVQAYYNKLNKTAETINRRHQDPATWLGMADDLDGRIGAVLDKIKELGIEENTYVVLTSDNGYRHSFLPGLKQPHHMHKWWIWQGGIRVPMIAKGPGIPAGSRFEGNVVNYDFLPTFYEWAGGNASKLKNIDGVSLAGYMKGQKPGKDFLTRNLYFHYPHYRTTVPHSAIVSGSQKVLHFYANPDISLLFDLSIDQGEVHNIAGKKSREHQELYDHLMDYLRKVEARFPKENPNYDPKSYKNNRWYENRETGAPFTGSRQLQEDEK